MQLAASELQFRPELWRSKLGRNRAWNKRTGGFQINDRSLPGEVTRSCLPATIGSGLIQSAAKTAGLIGHFSTYSYVIHCDVGKAFSGNSPAFSVLAESIRSWLHGCLHPKATCFGLLPPYARALPPPSSSDGEVSSGQVFRSALILQNSNEGGSRPTTRDNRTPTHGAPSIQPHQIRLPTAACLLLFSSRSNSCRRLMFTEHCLARLH